MHTTVNN